MLYPITDALNSWDPPRPLPNSDQRANSRGLQTGTVSAGAPKQQVQSRIPDQKRKGMLRTHVRACVRTCVRANVCPYETLPRAPPELVSIGRSRVKPVMLDVKWAAILGWHQPCAEARGLEAALPGSGVCACKQDGGQRGPSGSGDPLLLPQRSQPAFRSKLCREEPQR
jgi:hypothetical protein